MQAVSALFASAPQAWRARGALPASSSGDASPGGDAWRVLRACAIGGARSVRMRSAQALKIRLCRTLEAKKNLPDGLTAAICCASFAARLKGAIAS
jgi:hypothetical protein